MKVFKIVQLLTMKLAVKNNNSIRSNIYFKKTQFLLGEAN